MGIGWRETVPVGVKNHRCVSTEQRNTVWQLAPFLKRNDSERSTTTGFPIDRNVLGVNLVRGTVRSALLRRRSGAVAQRTDLDQVGIPGISRDAKVIVALFLQPELKSYVEGDLYSSRRSTFFVERPKTWPSPTVSGQLPKRGNTTDLRYFEERTKRPDMVGTESR